MHDLLEGWRASTNDSVIWKSNTMLTAWSFLISVIIVAAWLVIRQLHIYGGVGMLVETEMAAKWFSRYRKIGIGGGRFDLYTC